MLKILSIVIYLFRKNTECLPKSYFKKLQTSLFQQIILSDRLLARDGH